MNNYSAIENFINDAETENRNSWKEVYKVFWGFGFVFLFLAFKHIFYTGVSNQSYISFHHIDIEYLVNLILFSVILLKKLMFHSFRSE